MQSIFDLYWSGIIKDSRYIQSSRSRYIHANEVIIFNRDLNILGVRIDSAYYLMPLDEVEDFIKKNSHLPDIPSAEEVKDGYEIGAMNAILLKKIEKLALNIIQQQKQIEELEQMLKEKAKHK